MTGWNFYMLPEIAAKGIGLMAGIKDHNEDLELLYPDLSNSRTSSFDYTKVKNIFKRVIIRDDILGSFVNFDKYLIGDNERPDQIAYKFYNDANLDWVILTVNKITNIKNQWPLSNDQFYKFTQQKYTDDQLSQIRHYETVEIKDSKNRLIQQAGIQVSADHSITYVDNNNLITNSQVKPISYYDYEYKINEDKRLIDLIKPKYITIILDDMRNIMQYKESSQYIDKKLKQTENPRIFSP
jgi:hypothetical protein